MLRRLTYISGFWGKAQYVVPSAVRLRATCRSTQARISLTSVEELHAITPKYRSLRRANRPWIGPFKRWTVWVLRGDLERHVPGDRSINEVRMFAKGIGP